MYWFSRLAEVFRKGGVGQQATVPGTWLISTAWSVWGGSGGVSVKIHQGQAWATLGAEGRDLVMEMGDELWVPPGQQAVFSPLGQHHLVLQTHWREKPGKKSWAKNHLQQDLLRANSVGMARVSG